MLKRALAFVAMSVLTFGAVSLAAPETSDALLPGFTKPSEQRGLNFNGPGVVAKVLVKEGDIVKKGQLLAEQDTRSDAADLAVLEAKANEADVEIKAAESTLAEKKVVLEKQKKMAKVKVTNDLELEQAQLDVDIEEFKLDYSKQEKAEKFLEVAAQKAKLELKELRATTDGIVQQINVHEGELSANDPKTPVIMVVTNEPLYVEVDMPASLAKPLKEHQKLDVRYDDDASDAWMQAEIIYFNPVANTTTLKPTQHVRLLLANPDHLRSGMNVWVRLPKTPVASAQSTR